MHTTFYELSCIQYQIKRLWTTLHCFVVHIFAHIVHKKSKHKSPGRATSRSRSQPLTPGGREKVTQINVCIANKQMHDKHKDQLPLSQAR